MMVVVVVVVQGGECSKARQWGKEGVENVE